MNLTHQGQNWFPIFTVNGPITKADKSVENCILTNIYRLTATVIKN